MDDVDVALMETPSLIPVTHMAGSSQLTWSHPWPPWALGTNAYTHTSICVCACVQWNLSSTEVKGLYEAAVTVRSGASKSTSYRENNTQADIESATLQGRGSVLTHRDTEKHGRGYAPGRSGALGYVYPGRAHRNNLEVPVLSIPLLLLHCSLISSPQQPPFILQSSHSSKQQRLASLILSTPHSLVSVIWEVGTSTEKASPPDRKSVGHFLS